MMPTSKSKEFDYASIAPGYYDEIFLRGRGVQSAWHHLKFDYLRRMMPENYSNHLDIGCGPGTFIGTLPAERRSLGIDIATSQIQYAQAHYGTEYHAFARENVLEEMPFEEGSFDVVTIVELIEHLPMSDLDPLLSAAAHALSPAGVLLVTTPNYGSLWPLLEKAVNRLGEVTYEDQHISLFKRRSLLDLLERVGFEAPSVTTFHGVAPFLAAANWNLASAVHRVETPFFQWGMGFLLLGIGRKRSNIEEKSGN